VPGDATLGLCTANAIPAIHRLPLSYDYSESLPMKTLGTIADFRRWLRAEIAELDEGSPQENQFWEAAGTIREAR